jgi:hypothetical protein
LLRGVGFTWLLWLPTLGVDVDGLDCPLHHPTTYSNQARGQSFLLGSILSLRAAVGGGAFLGGGCEAPGLEYLMEC